MKLINFNAEEIYGYLNFNINFYDDISFLVGVNGSGKSTVLLLIQALLTPSIHDLIFIPFKNLSIAFENKGIKNTIYAVKKSGQLDISVSEINEKLTFPVIDQDEIEFILSRENRGSEFLEDLQLKQSDHKVFQFISNISAPVFLGLERTHKGAQEVSNALYDRERMLTSRARSGFRARRIVKGSLAAGLMETQVLIQEAYRRLRRSEEKLSERLREDILLSGFKYYDLNLQGNDVGSLLPTWMERDQIRQKKIEIESALVKIGLSKEKIMSVLEDFFKRIEILFTSISSFQDSSKNIDNEQRSFPIEWIINKSQIDRVTELIRIIDNHKSKTDQIFTKIITFLESINSFYVDTGKSIQIDTVGQLVMYRPDTKSASIDALSSGERQLLIMFAHLLFNDFGSRSNVFIIDEPELSLHLKWQEKFVSKAIEVSPNVQLILATHSPEIIAGYEKKSISV